MHTYFPGVHMWSIFAIVNILMFWFLFKEKILNEDKYHSNKRPMGHITHLSKEFSCEILLSYKDSTLRVYQDVFIVISQIIYIWSKRFFFPFNWGSIINSGHQHYNVYFSWQIEFPLHHNYGLFIKPDEFKVLNIILLLLCIIVIHSQVVVVLFFRRVFFYWFLWRNTY